MREPLLGLLQASATAEDAPDLLAAALPVLAATGAATGLAVVEHRGGQQVLGCGAGELPEGAPEAWPERDDLERRPVDDAADLLVLRPATAEPEPDHAVALAGLVAGLARVRSVEALRDLRTHVAEVQELAGLGDFDWHVGSDVVTWSDQMFRIFGHEPGGLTPTYATFIDAVHPDDRARIMAVHQQAHADGRPFGMVGRVVRPDGSVRHVSSVGEVVLDPSGNPERMHGTSLDVTERVVAEQERERSVARFRGLLDASPRAILLVDGEGVVVQANSRASEMLAGDPVGERATRLLPHLRTALGLTARLLDGAELVVDVLIAPLPHADDAEQAWDVVFVEDASARLEREGLSTRLHEARMRRRQALEINDNVVQGLVAACYALDAERYPVVATYLRRTLDAARSMMNDLLDPLTGEDLAPGALVRRTPAALDAPLTPGPGAGPSEGLGERPGSGGGRRVLVVDDAADLRLLTRTVLDRVDGLSVVGEAADGLDGVERATELQPDLVVLDLAMPRMDGLEALPRIKAAVPGVRVVVFSGFDEATLADQAVAAGADGYAAKGGSMRDLVDVVTRTLREAPTPA